MKKYDTMYKIVRKEFYKGNEELCWLFHTAEGTRKITPHRWQTATIKENATDGAGSTYRSGFHTLESLEDLIDYGKRFKLREGLVICKCRIDGEIWEKTKSNHPVILSSKIIVEEIVYDFEKNVDLKEAK